MKQRLLLALLMLLTSAGFLKANIVFKVPKNTGTVTVTFSGTAGGIKATSISGLPQAEVSGKGLVYTIKNNSVEVAQYTFDTSNGNFTLNPCNVTFTVTGDASVTEINAQGVPNLNSFTASGVGLTSLTLNSPDVKIVDVSNNKLAGFDVSSLNALVSINASNNQIASLGTGFASGANNTLKKVYLSNNKIGGGDFSELAVVETFEIENNELTDLNLKAATKLSTLRVSGNSLKHITCADGVTPVWGTQTFDLGGNTIRTANEGLNVLEVLKNKGYLLTESKNEDLSSSKMTGYVWRKLSGGSYVDAKDEAHALFATNPEQFYFAKASGDKYVFINTSTTYECEFTYDGKVTVKLQNIVINPAKLTLKKLPESLRYVNSTATRTDNEVHQGDHLQFWLKDSYKDYSIKTFKDVTALTATDDAQMTKDGGEFIVAGYFQKGASTVESGIVNPSINVELTKASCEVSFDNTQQKGGQYKIESIYENKTTELTSGKKNQVTKGSTIKVTITEDTGFTAKISVNGEDKSASLVPDEKNKSNKILTIDNLSENVAIVVTFAEVEEVATTLTIEGVEIGSGVFTDNKVVIGGKDFTTGSMGKVPLPVGKTQLSFNLTTQAVYASNAGWSSWIVDAVMVDGVAQLVAAKTIVPESELQNQTDPAIKYTYDITIPKTETNITIKFKKQTKVTITPEGGADKKEQHQAYDKTPKTFKFTTSPKGLENSVQVLYTNADLQGAKPTTDAPTAAGTYNVTVSIPATGTGEYTPIWSTAYPNLKLVIDPAKLNFETAPTITVGADGKYVIAPNTGKVTLGSVAVAGNYLIVTKGNTPDKDKVLDAPTDANKNKSHLVTVKFVANNGTSDDPNYAPAYIETEVVNGEALKDYTVDLFLGNEGDKFPGNVTIYNEDKVITPGTKVKEGTELTFKIEVPKTIDLGSVKLATIKSDKPLGTVTPDPNTRIVTVTDVKVEVDATYKVLYNVSHEITNKYKVELKEQKVTYNEALQEYDLNYMTITGETTPFDETVVKKYVQITYKDKNGAEVVTPKNAGTYTVCVSIPYLDAHTADGNYKTYAAFADEYEAALVIEPAEIAVKDLRWPTTSSLIAKKQTLANSALSGGNSSKIPGKFKWEDEGIVPESGKAYSVIFDPDDDNYAIVKGGDDHKVYVNVSNAILVTFVPENCKVVVTDASGKEYATGDVVAKGAVLTIKATPFTDCEMKTFTVNGKPFTSGSTYTVTDETVEIVAIAQLKDVNPESVVITLPENDEVQGAILTKTGAQEVAFNGELTFSVATLAADKNKVSVTANGVTLKPNSNGVYTVKADKNKTVSVSVANPTAIVVKADTTLSPGLKPMGKVEIQGWTSTKKYYYGDVVTVTAFPESGVTFVGWKGFTDDSNPLEVILKEPSYTFKALYKGIPTGIEDIMAASIATGKGCVWVRGIANADVTIVSISGRVQARQRISGDTRIDVPAGIYVVVLESGSDVKRVKVIVK